MLARIQRLLAAPVFEDDDKARVAGLLNFILLAVFATAVMLTLSTGLLGTTNLSSLAIGAAMAVLALGLQIVMRLGHVRLASILLSTTLWAGATAATYLAGTTRDPIVGVYIICLVIAGLLVSGRAAIAFTMLSLLTLLGLLQAETAGLLPPVQTPVGITLWVVNAAVFGMTAVLLVLASRSIGDALDRARGYAAILEEQRESLEEMVARRTQDVTRRARYLEATAEVARDAASELDLQGLLSKIVLLISAQFGFYHTGIFLLDETGEYAVLRAASSAGGQRMLARGHRLRVGQEGVVGYVTGEGLPRIALDTGVDEAFFDNPDLPETRSELVLPLRARGDLIGALDVQSREPKAFGEEDVSALETLANQVALAISNAQLFARTQESLEAVRRAYGEVSQKGWVDVIRARPSRGYRYDQHQVVPMEEAGAESGGPEADLAALALPLQYGDRVLGIVKAHKRADAGEWAADEVALIHTLAEQLNVALESARLYEDTQRRAAREQLAGQITGRMQQATDMEGLIQNALKDLLSALTASQVVVHLGTEEELSVRLGKQGS